MTTLDPQSKKFKNIPVNEVAEAVSRALSLSNPGLDVYIALAEYTTTSTRQASNVSGAYAFCGDIDCGDEKAVSGKGYATIEEAEAALLEFCKSVCLLAMPTFIVSSGGGLHVYWVLDSFISREKWQAYAIKLRALTHELAFLADDTRTADIASVLRMLGTLNHKYEPPRLVTLRQASSEFIEQSAFFDAIDSAHLLLGNVAKPKQPEMAALRLPLEPKSVIITRLKSLLSHINANCGYVNWLNVLMAIFHESGGSEEDFHIANSWSSKGKKYKGIEEICTKWNSFRSYKGTPITIATLVKMSRDHCKTEVTALSLQSTKPAIEVANPLTKYSLLDRSNEVEKQTVEQVPAVGNIALMGQSTIIYAAPNTGKTLIALSLLIESIK